MAMGRPKVVLALDAEQCEQLESLAKSRSVPAGLVRRAKIILLCASRKTNLEFAGQPETSDVTVGLWRRRFLAHGVDSMTSYGRVGPVRSVTSAWHN
jgi:putative transposase